MKKLLLLLTAVATLFAACNNDHECAYDNHSADLVGTWTCLTAGYAEVLVISADGSAVSTGADETEMWENVKGSVVAKNGRITMNFEDNDNFEGHFDIIPGVAFSIYTDAGERLTYNYCTNDLSEEIVGMWICTQSSVVDADMAINVYKNDGTALFTGFLPDVDGYMVNLESTYKVVGDLLIQKMSLVSEDAVGYMAFRLNYSSNATGLGDILTVSSIVANGENVVESYSSLLRVKQSLDLEGKSYDYNGVYVTNVKGLDKEFEFVNQTLNFNSLNGSAMDKFMNNILFNLSFEGGKMAYSCFYNNTLASIEAPIEVEGNKITVKMSQNKSTYRDIVMYAFQDVDDCQLHIYMPTTSFETFIANVAVVMRVFASSMILAWFC
ncbi:MAG: hypothetical protein IKV60_02785, partial [Rikenellaceae bacterium]|nr:hypothetical protein [Rikenellaceae bacterium]